ncbi:hypothetical protein Gogos_022063, partial [Gossypium gossypioides]|nr:hypothetical protein [Gossypium gossypioides]
MVFQQFSGYNGGVFYANQIFTSAETRKMQRLARDNVRMILEEQEKQNHELETKKMKIDN